MKSRPILFSAPMVRAILENRKTQTRRIVKRQPNIDAQTGDWLFTCSDGSQEVLPIEKWIDIQKKLHCPYGKVGDRIWVREEHYRFGHWKRAGTTRTDRDKWSFVPDTDEVLYDSPVQYRKSRDKQNPSTPTWHKRLARFMPRTASRITLEITGIRVERLHDMGSCLNGGDAAAVSEGVEQRADGWYKCYLHPGSAHFNARMSFQTLWESINGPDSWHANPWVWVIEFERVV